MPDATKLPYSPVVIIGAARSGTNMLRDVLTSLDGMGTWPCDEINYIWRYGNSGYPTDALPPALATGEIRAYVRGAFSRMARQTNSDILIEKTCANSLRIPFVDRILPEAKFLYIVRDGADVVHSAMKRWRARPELGYIARKARFVPPREIPYYATRFVRNQVHRLTSSGGTLKTWGPRFEGIDELVRQNDLATVCATQWLESVRAAESDLARIDRERIHRVRYEAFVADPLNSLQEILRFLDVPASDIEELRSAVADVSPSSVGRGRRGLSPSDRDSASRVMRPLLEQLGYEE